MKPRTLRGRVLGWQIAITGSTCLLLVATTLAAGRWVIRHAQDDRLSDLAQTLCSGARHELEEYHAADLVNAARHFFHEARLPGHRFELTNRAGDPLASYPESEPSAARRGAAAAGCRSEEGPADAPAQRACANACGDEYFVSATTTDALHVPAVARATRVLFASTVGALLVGALVGRLVTTRLLRPLERMRDAAVGLRPGPGMSLGVGADVDELAQVEHACDGLLRFLGEMLEREKRFSQQASHELRTPLTNLRLRLERLQAKASVAPEAAREARAALRELDRLNGLTDGLLTLSRSEFAELPRAPVNLGDLAREVAAEATRAGARVAVEAPDELLVQGNEELLHRAVCNLVENAQRHAGERPRICIRVQQTPGYGVIAVEDDGPGIARELRPFVFEPFFRGSDPKQRDGGTGLGLSVVHAILRRHGGRARTGPGPSGGEQVALDIPLARATPESSV